MPLNNHVGGYRIDLEDRDWLDKNSLSVRSIQPLSANDRPAVIDPRKWSKIRSQGQEGSCQGHSISACGEGCYYIASNDVISFSPDVAYYQTQKIDGLLGADNGSTIAGGMKMATTVGFCPEKYMPYSDRYNPQDQPPNVLELCSPYKVAKHIVFKGPDYFSQVVDWIGSGFGFVSYGISWGVQLDASGVAHWNPGNGGHANAVLGYMGDTDSSGLPKYLIAKNSWGDWGPLHGWYLWTRNEFNRVMSAQYSVIIGVSDMHDVKPRRISWAESYPS